MAKRNIPDRTLEEVQDAIHNIVLLKAQLAKERKIVFDYVKLQGGISHDGLHAFHQQTIGHTYSPQPVVDAIEEHGINNPLLWVLNEFVTPANMRKLVQNSEYSEYLQVLLRDEHGNIPAQIPLNGGAKIDVRGSEPVTGEHHVIGPGEKALDKFEDPN